MKKPTFDQMQDAAKLLRRAAEYASWESSGQGFSVSSYYDFCEELGFKAASLDDYAKLKAIVKFACGRIAK